MGSCIRSQGCWHPNTKVRLIPDLHRFSPHLQKLFFVNQPLAQMLNVLLLGPELTAPLPLQDLELLSLVLQLCLYLLNHTAQLLKGNTLLTPLPHDTHFFARSQKASSRPSRNQPHQRQTHPQEPLLFCWTKGRLGCRR